MGRRMSGFVGALALIVAACGGDDGSESYFESVGGVTTGYVAEVAGLPEAGTGGSLDDARAFFSGVSSALAVVRTELDGISPPDAAHSAHAEFVRSVGEFADLAGRVAARGSDLQTRDDLIAMANDPELGVANYRSAAERVVVACNALQAVADADTIDVDLACPSLGRS